MFVKFGWIVIFVMLIMFYYFVVEVVDVLGEWCWFVVVYVLDVMLIVLLLIINFVIDGVY